MDYNFKAGIVGRSSLTYCCRGSCYNNVSQVHCWWIEFPGKSEEYKTHTKNHELFRGKRTQGLATLCDPDEDEIGRGKTTQKKVN